MRQHHFSTLTHLTPWIRHSIENHNIDSTNTSSTPRQHATGQGPVVRGQWSGAVGRRRCPDHSTKWLTPSVSRVGTMVGEARAGCTQLIAPVAPVPPALLARHGARLSHTPGKAVPGGHRRSQASAIRHNPRHSSPSLSDWQQARDKKK